MKIIIIMQNLTQIKSRQFHKYATIEPFVRSTSNHILEQGKLNNKHASLMRTPNQNSFHLANVVKQILEMKPKTAQKVSSKQSSRNHKTQSLVQPRPSIQFFCNNAKRNQQKPKECNDNEEDEPAKTSLSKQKSNINFIQIDNRLNSKKMSTSKSSRTLKREYYRNIQSFNNFDTIPDKNKQTQAEQKVDPISKTQDHQCKIRITKRKTQVQIPKTKLSIKNLDKLIEMAPRNYENRGRPIKYDLNLPKPCIQAKEFQQDCEIVDIKGWKQRRTKKSITDFKVPEFIKNSLEAYRQEPHYLIEQLEKRKLRQVTTQKIDQHEYFQEIQIKEQYKIQERMQQQQRLVSNKIKLLQKEKKKAIIQPQFETSIINDAAIPISLQPKIEKKKPRPKKKEQVDDKINICGWEEQDPNIPQTFYFKL